MTKNGKLYIVEPIINPLKNLKSCFHYDSNEKNNGIIKEEK
jgi:hypothetical protein